MIGAQWGEYVVITSSWNLMADADKMGKLGWKPKVGIEEGIRRFVEWHGNASLGG